MLEISRFIETQARAFIADLPERKTTNSVVIDDDGQAHVRGGAFNASRARAAMSIAYGITPEDATAFRKALKEHGITLAIEHVDATLMEALSTKGTSRMPKTQDEKRAYRREQIARRRQWARENGYCVICTKNAGTYTSDGGQMATCQECRDRVPRKNAR